MKLSNLFRIFACFFVLVLSTQASRFQFKNLDRNEREQFLALTNWKRYTRMVRIRGERRRKVFYRSLREETSFKNPSEEFYSLIDSFYKDKNFKCDNLAAYEFYTDITGETPYPLMECDNFFSTFITVSSGYKEIGFYKNRVTMLSYLMASNGESAMSRFGHSMFYIRACTKDIDDCPLKDQVEFVLGVVADVDDLAPVLTKGIFGGYATKLDLMTLSQVKQKYNYDEFRNLEQYNLKLTKRDTNRFISHAINLYVNKDMGRYKFFSANCATESYKILRASVDANRLRSRPLTPKGLLKDLKQDDFVEDQPNRQFLEKSGKINSYLKQLGFEKFVDYYATPSQERFQIASNIAKVDLFITRGAFVFLEKMALVKLQNELANAAVKSKDKTLNKEFLSLAHKYKQWARDNRRRARLGLAPVKSDVVGQMNDFYLENYNYEVKDISTIANNIKKAKNGFK